MRGDCLEVMKQIPDGSVDMILCDLPYGTTQNKWDTIIPLDQLWPHYWRVLKPAGAIVLTAQTPFDKVLGASCIERLKYEWVWIKQQGTGFLNSKKMPLKATENVLVFYKNPPTYNPRMRQGFSPYVCKAGAKSANYGQQVDVTTVSNGDRFPLNWLEFGYDKDKVHPTQKPVGLFEYLIRTYTNEGQVVLDNCAGSGTTAVAAIRSGRRFLCIEQDANYFELANGRVRKELGDKENCPLKLFSGKISIEHPQQDSPKREPGAPRQHTRSHTMAINQDEKLSTTPTETPTETPAQEGLRLADERAAAATSKAAKAALAPRWPNPTPKAEKPVKEKAPKVEKPAKVKAEKVIKVEKAPKPAAQPVEAKPVLSDKAVFALSKAHAVEIKQLEKAHAAEIKQLEKRITELKKAVDLETDACAKELAKKDKQHEAQLARIAKDAKASLKVAADEALNHGKATGHANGTVEGYALGIKAAIAAVKAL